MDSDPESTDLIELVHELCELPKETEWVEFKHNRADPEEIGEYISALANSAVLADKQYAFLLWGVENKAHRVVGTTFRPERETVGGEELEHWLLKLLTPQIDFRFSTVEIDGQVVVVLRIGRALHHPVKFKKQPYIRVGSYKKRLCDYPEKERQLWLRFNFVTFERGVARGNLSGDDVVRLLDYTAYFDLLEQRQPDTQTAILQVLESDRLIEKSDSGRWKILNLGAILFAKQLGEFEQLRRKAVRVIVYKGTGRIETVKEQEGGKGYASGFEGLIAYINSVLPSNEIIGQALRKDVPVYPELAVRELVANTLIHQDFSVTGAGPMIEIFDDRMEVTNPGEPLVEPERFLDKPPRSRNESLASFMRRVGVCEERGSGVDKVVSQTELYQLPAPKFELIGDHTRASLFAPMPMNKMRKQDRIRACYLHACLKYVTNDIMTNASLRKRFGMNKGESSLASRLIKHTMEAGLVRPQDESAARSQKAYVPFWA